MPEIERIGLRLGAGEDVQLTLESETLQLPEINVEDLPLSVVHLSQGERAGAGGQPCGDNRGAWTPLPGIGRLVFPGEHA